MPLSTAWGEGSESDCAVALGPYVDACVAKARDLPHGVLDVMLAHLVEFWAVQLVGAHDTAKLLNCALHPDILRP